MMENTTFAKLPLLFLLLQATLCQAQYQCNWDEEPCGSPLNGRCDVGGDGGGGGGSCPSQSDCYDCDPMQEFNYNCEACVQAGGFWCPGDARCQSTPLGQSYFSSYRPFSFSNSCPNQNDWIQSCPTFNSTTSAAVFSDPLYESMAWQYKMIRVEEVWRQGVTGAGVNVRINDGGIDPNHDEIAPNLNRDNSCQGSFRQPENDHDNTGYAHGTAVASILAGAGNNNQCAVGIAPGASISFCKKDLRDPLADVQLLTNKMNTIDVSSNSWGPIPCFIPLFGVRRRLQSCPFQFNGYPTAPCKVCGNNINLDNEDCKNSIVFHCENFFSLDRAACLDYLEIFVKCTYHSLPAGAHDAMARAVAEGRDGKGIIFVFPAGNEDEEGSFSAFDGFVNSRFTIAVAGVDKQAKAARYSTRGSSVFIAAPGGDHDHASNNIVANYGGGCRDSGPGTSFSTPVVSGVVALMLQVNPNLTWRDVQGVLAASAQYNDPDDGSWSTNAAGIKHSYKYGFGLVDAAAAVDLSKTWLGWGREQQITVESGSVDIPIPDDGSQQVVSRISVSEDSYSNFITESVEVHLDLQHGSRGDVLISLISPSGTTSVLAVGKRPENTVLEDGERWKLTTVRNWGESPVGEWKLVLLDQKEGLLVEGCTDILWFWYDLATDDLVGCESVEKDGACVDGEEVGRFRGRHELRTMFGSLDQQNFYSPLEACCVCGGGSDHSVEQVLKSWSMVVYGHSPPPTSAPTGPPTSAPTGPPTSAPTGPPTSAAPTPASTPASVATNEGGTTDVEKTESISRTAPVEWTESPTDITEETMTVGPSEEASTVGPTGYENATFGPSDEGIDESTEIPAEVSRSRSEGDASDKEGLEGDTPIRGADDLPFSSANPILSQSFLSFVAGLFALCEILMPLLY